MKLKFVLLFFFNVASFVASAQEDSVFVRFYQNELLLNKLEKELKMADSIGLDHFFFTDSADTETNLLMNKLDFSEDSVLLLHLSKYEYARYDFLIRNEELPEFKRLTLSSGVRIVKEGLGEDWDGNVDGLPAYSPSNEKKSDYYLRKIKKMINLNKQAASPNTYESYLKDEKEILGPKPSESELIQFRLIFIRYLNEKKRIPIPD